ncbi:conserved hypothetical protein [Ixodes scapularis]|uniref:cholesterol 7-desaturase n=2 Tax=Ixodes scapularis TaxID=6945 RepID=B7Q1J5_IXOSC|nr:conserved hypothetical protein [Ixodes scapularis]|eukprot:XP_002409726.1 conserved hypothetical protein [Ixodes scapularis]
MAIQSELDAIYSINGSAVLNNTEMLGAMDYRRTRYTLAGHETTLWIAVAAIACVATWATWRRRRVPVDKKYGGPSFRRTITKATPPVFPNGWIPVLESSKLANGAVERLDVLGLQLVALRTEEGEAHVMDAYCPHLGAHLGVMGRVVGDCIECPFHGWRFRAKDGACTHVPYSAKVPEFVKAKTWPCREIMGLLFVWYHAEDETPGWEIPDDILTNEYEPSPTGSFEHVVHCHIQDIAENGADLGHFNQIHRASSLVDGKEFSKNLGESWKGRLFTHHWDATWTSTGHTGVMKAVSSVELLGMRPKHLRYYIEARQHGPALVTISVHGKAGNYVAVQSLVPEGPFKIRMQHRLYFEPGTNWVVRLFHTMAMRHMVDRDAEIWNHKIFLKQAALVKEDKTIAAFRKWYSQFYSDNSTTWQELRERTLEW